MIHRVQGFHVVNETSFSGIPLLSLWSNGCWQFDLWFLCHFETQLVHLEVHILLKPRLKDFEHYLTSMWNEHKCTVVWTLFGIALLWDFNENWPFPVLWPLLSFSNLLTYWVQHFHSIKFFHAKTGTIKDRNGMDLTEAENIKKRWHEYIEELYKKKKKKGLNDPDIHDAVITHLEPDVLECKVKWALGSITTNKTSGCDGIPVELL